MEKQERINKLAALAEKCNYAYRTGDVSWFEENGFVPLTDPEYDALLDELATLDPNHPTLKKVGYEVAVVDPARKQPLPVKMLSAKKVKSIEEIWKWLSNHNIPKTRRVVWFTQGGI